MKSGCLRSRAAGHRQRRLADARRPGQPREQRQVPLIDDQPARQELSQNRVLADPLLIARVGSAQMERHPVDFHCLASSVRPRLLVRA